MKLPLAASLAMLTLLAHAPARATECPHKDALGTARVMTVASRDFPRIGLKHFPATLPLADKEVVLTFDDGPFPPLTRRVLDTLAAANPALVRRIADDGHTVAHHSWSHPVMTRLGDSAAKADIDRGFAAVDAATGGAPKPPDMPRFFRFPGFASTPALLSHLEQRNVVVFGADLWASDWNAMTPDQQLRQLTERLRQARKGVILMHDIRAQTAAMLPAFLRYLKQNGYRVVHVAPEPQ